MQNELFASCWNFDCATMAALFFPFGAISCKISCQGCTAFVLPAFPCFQLPRKTWACCSQGAVNDESILPEEVDPYLIFLRHLMYYHDRWSSKLWGSDAFLEVMVQTIRKLESLKRDTSDARQKYLRVLEHISDASSELLDHALRVTILLVSDQHAELEQLVAKEGPMTLKFLAQPYHRHNSQFWSTDLGQVLHAALVRSDPQRFKPTGTGDTETVTAARIWTLWTDELRTPKRYEYSSPEEARQVFEQCRCCTILVGPEGKIQEKSFAAGQMLAKALLLLLAVDVQMIQ